MAQKYAKGSRAWGICGRSGKKMLLDEMTFDGRYPNMRVDPAWYEGKHPQEYLPKVDDPTALFRPSPEVILAPTAPVLVVAQVDEAAVLTWTPAENDITEIAAYTIMRSVDAGEYAELAFCGVIRDYLCSIIGIENCTTSTVPTSADKQFFDDAPVSYTDPGVQVGHTYCYYVFASPLGNNLSTAQGPPSPPSNIACLTIATFFRLLEDGSIRATEAGDRRVLQESP